MSVALEARLGASMVAAVAALHVSGLSGCKSMCRRKEELELKTDKNGSTKRTEEASMASGAARIRPCQMLSSIKKAVFHDANPL